MDGRTAYAYRFFSEMSTVPKTRFDADLKFLAA